MIQIFWDASGLTKHFYRETGADTVEAIFAVRPVLPMTVTFLGYAETSAMLLRKLNGGLLDAAAFAKARIELRDEVLLNPNVRLLSVTDADILNGIALTDRHNLNASDAAILAAYLRLTRAVHESCVLVAADRRLLRACRHRRRRAAQSRIAPLR